MPTTLYLDIETFAALDIKKVSVYRYRECPRFQLLMCAWTIDDQDVRVHVGSGLPIFVEMALADPSVLKVAFNAQFERVCLDISSGPWHDPAAVAAEKGYPHTLGKVAEWLDGEQKDSAGTRLINLFCKPNRRGERNLPEDYPVEWAEFVEYCRQDVVTLRDVHRRLGDFPTETERAVYDVDQRINDRGLAVDLRLAAAAKVAAEANTVEHKAEAAELTGIDNPNSGPQIMAWFEDQGRPIPNLKKETVAALLESNDLTDVQRRLLKLRQELALTAATKFGAALEGVCADGRLRGALRFFGAHTGRWTGKGVQPQNLPRQQLATEVDTEAAILDLLLGFGCDANTAKALVRSMFVGPFTVVDYASIEARVLAWEAGEQWALDAFAKGRDIYVETAERMSTPGNRLSRSQGKVAVLALGYNGSLTSLRAMGAAGGEDQLMQLVYAWRDANPAIVGFWEQMGQAFRSGGPVGDHIRIDVDGNDRLMQLPSGRAIVYHDVRHQWVNRTYKGKTRRVLEASFRDPGVFGRERTYGGKLTENATQAIARDILAEALVNLDAAGYPIVAHVHDEVIVEGLDVPGVTEVMIRPPAWAGGLPIDAEGFTCRRYRKG